MDANKILIILLAVVLLTNILMVGLYLHEKGILFPSKGNETIANNVTGNETALSIAIYKTCSGLSGEKCDFDESCTGAWLVAADSFSCCSADCISRNETRRVINETFESDTESFDNIELGEII